MRSVSRIFLGSFVSLMAVCVSSDQVFSQPPTQTKTQSAAESESYNALYSRPINQADNAPLVSISKETGNLIYGPYANRGEPNDAFHIVPDFSFAGYGGGGVALPSEESIPVRVTLAPDGEADDRLRIQSAIDDVSSQTPDARGIRGAILLKAGEWQVSAPLEVRASGIILRGEGQGEGGTVIRANSTEDRDTLLYVRGKGDGRHAPKAAAPNVQKIVQDYVPVGSNSVAIKSSAGYKVGDKIGIRRTPNNIWVGANGVNGSAYGWTPERYNVVHERTLLEIRGNTLIFDIPITDGLDGNFGGGEVYRLDTSGRLQQIGIENLRMDTLRYRDVKRQDRAFYGIRFKYVENSWVRDVTLRSFSHAYSFGEGTRAITAEDVAHLDPNFEIRGGNHYSFIVQDGMQILFQRCFATNSRHALITGSTVPGPNVYLDCLARKSDSDSGPHHRWATGTLYDNVKDRQWRTQNRIHAGTGHGWAGAQQMLWNSDHDEIVLQAPPFAMNYAVGNEGKIIQGSYVPSEPNGVFEDHGDFVDPRSLYLKQLEERLGPEAVRAITLPEQRDGEIWDSLKKWKGEGAFEP